MAEYIVKSGDNLSTIAKNNNTTVQNLASINKIADVNKIGVGQKLVLGTPNVGASITSNNTAPATPTTVIQPQVSTGATTLQSDIISKGQADTARAVAEEARVATLQGSKAPTATENVLKNILGVSNTTTPTTPSTAPTVDNTMSTTNVNGITADTLASQRQGIQDTLNNVMGETRLTADEYAGTVDPAKAELNQINQQMNEEALAGRRRTEAVLQIPGITKEQAQDKINEISRGNASKLADLAVVQMAKQGAYDSAKEIADRAVQAKVEDQKNKLNALMFTYTENKELFTKAEQRAFETAQADRERKLNAEEKNLQRISDLSLQALADGAPASVVTKMRNAKTEAEAISIGGQYIGRNKRRLEEAQLSKIYSDINESKKAGGTVALSETLNKYASIGDPNVNKEVLSSILSGKQVSAGTKGRIAPAYEVLNALDDFSSQRQDGKFTGMGGFLGFAKLKEGVKGLFNSKDPEAIQNAQNIDAINLKVQQWASGASLTEQQTKQVNKLTPTTWDSDKEIQTKTTGLYNYMLNQVESGLLTDGVNVNFSPVNLFGKSVDPLGVVTQNKEVTTTSTDPLQLN